MIKTLEWDSKFFGVRIGSHENPLSLQTEQEFLKDAQEGGFDCVYVFIDPNDEEGMTIARKHRFFLADTRVWYRLHLDSYLVDPRNRVEILNSKNVHDLERVREIAQGLAKVSRFYTDPRFRAQAEAMYQLWVDKTINDPRGAIAIFKVSGDVAGFVAYEYSPEDIAELILVAVDAPYQGKGIGHRLMEGLNLSLLNRGAKEIWTKTQLRNMAANQHYQRMGFRSQKVKHIFHAWTKDF